MEIKTVLSPVHRLQTPTGSAGASRNPAPIIVRFTSKKARDSLYASRTKLKGQNIFINEHLTSENAKLFTKARKLVNDKKLEGAWTTQGIVYAKLSNLPSARPKKVLSLRDLPV